LRAGELERELKRLGQGLADLRQTRLDLGSRAGHLEARRLQLGETLDSCEAEVETLRTELHRRRSRLQSLREIHDRYEGFQRGTRAVMQSSASERGGDFERRGIHGLVADRIDAPVQLEAAVEAALGDRLGGILVESHEVGASAVKYLKDTASGRSAFVPVLPATPAPAFAFEDRSGWLTSGEGVIGAMADLVRFDPGYDGLAQCLLADTIVVESLDRAIELHADHEKAQLYKAQLLKRLGRHTEALRHYKRVVSINPNNLDAAREVRVANMREESKDKTAVKGPGGLFSKLLGGNSEKPPKKK